MTYPASFLLLRPSHVANLSSHATIFFPCSQYLPPVCGVLPIESKAAAHGVSLGSSSWRENQCPLPAGISQTYHCACQGSSSWRGRFFAHCPLGPYISAAIASALLLSLSTFYQHRRSPCRGVMHYDWDWTLFIPIDL